MPPKFLNRSVFAWLGLLLMAVCFARLITMPLPPRSVSAAPTVQKNSFVTVVLDAGHGGYDSGSVVGTILEKDLTLDVTKRVERALRANGIATLMTRNDDAFVSLGRRARIANQVRSSVFVSIHFNEGERPVASGIETYYADRHSLPLPRLISWVPFLLPRENADSPDTNSQSLAGFIQQSLVRQTQAVDRGTKGRQFFVIAHVTHPAVLVEGGFLSSKDEMTRLANSDYREKLATAIADGILRYRDAQKQSQTTLAVTAPVSAE
jgi:N-acetylmuramoyl-L-alanine amidase